jgi:hypothetical protein
MHRFNKAWIKRAVDAITEIFNVNIDCIGERVDCVVPYVLENHAAREYAAFVAQQVLQQIKFFASEWYFGSLS